MLLVISTLQSTSGLTSIVQTLSSRYAIVLGGYGPGYTELSQVILGGFFNIKMMMSFYRWRL